MLIRNSHILKKTFTTATSTSNNDANTGTANGGGYFGVVIGVDSNTSVRTLSTGNVDLRVAPIKITPAKFISPTTVENGYEIPFTDITFTDLGTKTQIIKFLFDDLLIGNYETIRDWDCDKILQTASGDVCQVGGNAIIGHYKAADKALYLTINAANTAINNTCTLLLNVRFRRKN